uniref:Uncharacterized protein n=1 Tax=Anguilla anguilla TaxID=7936 RepID=A0A0E9TX13_ANGAN
MDGWTEFISELSGCLLPLMRPQGLSNVSCKEREKRTFVKHSMCKCTAFF